MPLADSSHRTLASAASGDASDEYQGVIPLSGRSRKANFRTTAFRGAAYLLAFASGAATMFAFRGLLNPPTMSPLPTLSISAPPVQTPDVPVRGAGASKIASAAVEPERESSEPAPAAESAGALTVSGTLEPAPGHYARLPLATNQAVAFVDVKPGDRVKKGWQVFSHWESPERLQGAKLELAKSKKLLDVARSQAAAAEKTAARLRKIEGNVSAQDLQDAETAADIRRQELEAMQLAVLESESRFAALEFEFNQAFVTTPIDGIVAAVDLALGERRQGGAAFRGVTILDPSVLVCRCLLSERELSFVQQVAGTVQSPTGAPDGESQATRSDPATGRLKATIVCDGKQFEATLASVGVATDAASGLTPVVLEVENPDEILRAGTKVKVELSTFE